MCPFLVEIVHSYVACIVPRIPITAVVLPGDHSHTATHDVVPNTPSLHGIQTDRQPDGEGNEQETLLLHVTTLLQCDHPFNGYSNHRVDTSSLYWTIGKHPCTNRSGKDLDDGDWNETWTPHTSSFPSAKTMDDLPAPCQLQSKPSNAQLAKKRFLCRPKRRQRTINTSTQ